MNPLAYTAMLHSSNQQPDCRRVDADTPDIRMNFFFSRAAYRLCLIAERVWRRYAPQSD